MTNAIEGARLLIVEDDKDLRDALCHALRASGYTVASATNGREALDYLANAEPPRLVLLDLMMPVMNGWEFRDAQTRDDRLASIPVVILTADGRAGTRAENLGVADLLTKPIELGRLLWVVERYAG